MRLERFHWDVVALHYNMGYQQDIILKWSIQRVA